MYRYGYCVKTALNTPAVWKMVYAWLVSAETAVNIVFSFLQLIFKRNLTFVITPKAADTIKQKIQKVFLPNPVSLLQMVMA